VFARFPTYLASHLLLFFLCHDIPLSKSSNFIYFICIVLHYIIYILTCFLWVTIVLSISWWGWIVYDKLKIKSRALDEQKYFLKNRIARLEEDEREHQKTQNDNLIGIAQKKAEYTRYYQNAVEKLQEAHIIREAAENQIAMLKKQINKMQLDLHNARQRVKRLAEKGHDVL